MNSAEGGKFNYSQSPPKHELFLHIVVLRAPVTFGKCE